MNAALQDLRIAHALLRTTRNGIVGLDIRELTGGAKAFAIGADPAEQDTYCAAIDAGLKRLRGLTNHGYIIRRAAA